MIKKGANCIIDNSAIIEDGVTLGNNVIIKENVVIKKGSFIGDNCIIGEYQKEYYKNQCYTNPKAVIGENSLIRSYSVIYSGANLGIGFNTGHFTVIREDVIIDDNCSVGTYSTIANNVTIGANSKIHTHVLITDKSKIGNNVWIFSNVTTSTDIHPPCGLCDKGITIGDNSVIGAGTTCIPAIEIEENVVVSSGSLVSKNLKSGYLYGGQPAKKICELEKIPCNAMIYKSAYPWNQRENFYQ
ncbi:DapH/DapD/GlmU-related protein [Clostridium sp. DJ247]|uniref:DapH/DapD/GlmU-related protein n=1 Tax=Clostridium sp. DJ247 TaxID=2726188 RepID=UPI001625C214|nr:DapH/DapD/GlmU-related protein [Clostridium sp. DJ247]MBC2580266.1 N-acetyltransferase [Clostridium sp. DJ247]